MRLHLADVYDHACRRTAVRTGHLHDFIAEHEMLRDFSFRIFHLGAVVEVSCADPQFRSDALDAGGFRHLRHSVGRIARRIAVGQIAVARLMQKLPNRAEHFRVGGHCLLGGCPAEQIRLEQDLSVLPQFFPARHSICEQTIKTAEKFDAFPDGARYFVTII